MTGNAGARSAEPVVNPGVRGARARRLIRMTKDQIAGRTGPVRQIRYRDQVVSPLALELECRTLLQRAQRAIATIVTSKVYAGALRGTVEEPVLRQHEWEIAVALREITELLLDLVSDYAGGTAGPMTTTILVSQNRAITIARNATTTRVLALELLAAQVAAAEAARRDWETSHRMAANNDKYLDLVARTAADQRATVEITGLAVVGRRGRGGRGCGGSCAKTGGYRGGRGAEQHLHVPGRHRTGRGSGRAEVIRDLRRVGGRPGAVEHLGGPPHGLRLLRRAGHGAGLVASRDERAP